MQFGELYDPDLDEPGRFEMPNNTAVTTTPINEHWLCIIDLIEISGCWNKDICRIRVNTNWNFALLEQLLHGYHDKQITDLLQFGSPVERDNSTGNGW